MAVVIQPMVDAEAAGVAYSIHPVTGRSTNVVIDAVFGLAAPLVDGRVTPDHFVVEMTGEGEPVSLSKCVVADKTERLSIDGRRLRIDPLPTSRRKEAALSTEQVFTLAPVVKRVERVFECPVDLEWAFDTRQLWLLQARPITAIRSAPELTIDDCEWSRANFKETMPEVPSPMGRSFLEHFMDAYIIAQYRRLGCRIPQGLSSVRTLYGRPYLNVTLFYSLVAQLGGDPSLNPEQMGGEPLCTKLVVKRIGLLAFVRAGWLMLREMRRVVKNGPGYFAEMKALASTYHSERLGHFSPEELGKSLDELGCWLDRREVTFGIAAGVGQCLQTFSLFLPRWLGEGWRNLLNAALQGQGTVISAQQIVRLAELVAHARADETVTRLLLCESTDGRSYRESLQGTKFLASFERYLEDYGHRGLGESDVMSPRFADRPETLIAVIKAQLRGPDVPPARIAERQREVRERALAEVRNRCGWRIDRWLIFRWWYRRLCRFFALREANRHHLMYYSTAARNLLLRLGERLVERGQFSAPEDVFFLTMEEREGLTSGTTRDWAELVRIRRAEWEQWSKMVVPDTIRHWEEGLSGGHEPVSPDSDSALRGVPISPGCVTGQARLVRSAQDWSKVRAGDIIVAPVIDPGMVPLFGIAAGIVVEMGGTLSHGAIIAREYGLPAVANVGRVTELVADGERITLDAATGEVRRAVASVR
jgi:pyruvate,water dikinase